MKTDYHQTSMLDIVFEQRNKAYGAYVLRRDHDKDLRNAMAISLSAVFMLLAVNFISEKIRGSQAMHHDREVIGTLSDVILQKRNTIAPEAPKPAEKVQAKSKPTIRSTTMQVVTNSQMVKDSIPTVDDLKLAESGLSDNRNAVNDGAGIDGGRGTGKLPEPLGEVAPVGSEAVRIADIMPEFPGGEAKLLKFLADNTAYPDAERELGISGKVLTEVTIDLDGRISDVHIIKSPSPGFDKEVKRVAKIIPAFKPGMQQGHPVRVKMVIPFVFRSNN
jgi:periplasmic protein TonB